MTDPTLIALAAIVISVLSIVLNILQIYWTGKLNRARKWRRSIMASGVLWSTPLTEEEIRKLSDS